jgi:hypothetical protein
MGLLGSRSRNVERTECMLVLRYHSARQYHNLQRVNRFKGVEEQKCWNDKQISHGENIKSRSSMYSSCYYSLQKSVSAHLLRKVTIKYSELQFWSSGPGWRSWYSDLLQAERSGDRIPVEARFSAYVQTDPRARSASYVICTGAFPEVKLPRHGVEYPPTHIYCRG